MGAIVGEYTRRAASGAPIRPPQDDLNCPYYLTGRCAAFQGAGECARKGQAKDCRTYDCVSIQPSNRLRQRA